MVLKVTFGSDEKVTIFASVIYVETLNLRPEEFS